MTKLTWANETRKLSDLVPWALNPRQIRKDQAERLAASKKKFDQPWPLVIGPGNELYDGHQRLNVWGKEYGDIEVAVRVASRPLTELERQELTVVGHKGAAGEFDFDMLANWGLEGELLEWGFSEEELVGVWAEDDKNVFPDDHHEVPGMALLPNEKYDYVLLTFTRQSDFERAAEVLGLERLRDPRSGWAQHVGLCRVIDGQSVIEKLSNASCDPK